MLQEHANCHTAFTKLIYLIFCARDTNASKNSDVVDVDKRSYLRNETVCYVVYK